MIQEKFIMRASEYFNSYSLDELVEKYFNSDSSSINEEALKNALPSILYELYNLIITNDYVSIELKEEVIPLKIDDSLIEKLLFIWTHGAIECFYSFSKSPKDFNRNILIPLRATLSDVMYAGLSTMRCDYSYPVLLESNEYSFLSMSEYEDGLEASFCASDYLAYNVYDLENLSMCYGYYEAWVFDIKPGKIVILDDEESLKPMILKDAKGYGIIEGNLDVLSLYLSDTNATTESGVLASDMLGIDFADVDLAELIEIQDESFYITQYRYEANTAFDEDYQA